MLELETALLPNFLIDVFNYSFYWQELARYTRRKDSVCQVDVETILCYWLQLNQI
jgi:hypothetical protein